FLRRQSRAGGGAWNPEPLRAHAEVLSGRDARRLEIQEVSRSGWSPARDRDSDGPLFRGNEFVRVESGYLRGDPVPAALSVRLLLYRVLFPGAEPEEIQPGTADPARSIHASSLQPVRIERHLIGHGFARIHGSTRIDRLRVNPSN